MRDAQEHVAVPHEGLLQHRAVSGEPLQRPADGGARLVDPGAELRVATVVVAELVGEDGAQLPDAERLQQRQAQAHDPPAAEPHEAAARRHERVDVGDEVDLRRHGLLRADGDVLDDAEEPPLALARQQRARRLERVRARHDAPEDEQPADDAEEAEPIQAIRVRDLGVRQREQEQRDTEREQVEADHEQQREDRASGERGRPRAHKRC